MPGPLNELLDLRSKWGLLESQVSDDLGNDCLSSAYRQIVRECSEESITLALTNSTDEEKLIHDNLAEAEAYLTIGRIVQRTGLQIRQGGIIIQEQDGSSGMSEGRTIVNEYLEPWKIERYAQSFFEKAKPLMNLYLSDSGQIQIDISGLFHNFTEETETEF